MLVRARGVALALLVVGSSVHLAAAAPLASGAEGPPAPAAAQEVDDGVHTVAKKWWK
jgi:hypothetical protein